MKGSSLLELEKLISGKKETIELIAESSTIFRDEIISKLNELMNSTMPGCRLEGEFINKENSDYMVYELHVSGTKQNDSFSSITLFDFGDKVRLVRV